MNAKAILERLISRYPLNNRDYDQAQVALQQLVRRSARLAKIEEAAEQTGFDLDRFYRQHDDHQATRVGSIDDHPTTYVRPCVHRRSKYIDYSGGE